MSLVGSLIKLGEALLSVKEPVLIDAGCMLEPFPGLIRTTCENESVCVGIGQAGGGETGGFLIRVHTLKLDDSGIMLTEVMAGTRNNDGKFDPGILIQITKILSAGQVNGLLRASETAFTVGHDRDETRTSGHATCSPQLRERFLPFTGMVGGNATGFADHGDAASAILRGPGVAQRELRIIGQPGGSHDHVLCDGICIVLRQHPQVLQHQWIEILGIQITWQIRLIDSGVQPFLTETCTLRVEVIAFLGPTRPGTVGM